VLDVGCGRGEWLELLKDNDLAAKGVDLNATMQAQCVERGLDVAHADVLDYLRTLPDGQLGALTGFHIIEHLPLETLLDLVSQTYRVLRPGGVVIFESPNCKNLVVGACTFYLDPTHRNPVVPETAEFILESHGFVKSEINYLWPIKGSPFKSKSAESKLLNAYFFGPQDFSVVGFKTPLK
jgi:O-antigen chain-terminating methyltransferase